MIQASIASILIKIILTAIGGYIIIKLKILYSIILLFIGQSSLTISIDTLVMIVLAILTAFSILVILLIKKRNNIPRFKWGSFTLKEHSKLTLKSNDVAIHTKTFSEVPVNDKTSFIKGFFDWEGAQIDRIELVSTNATICLLDSNGKKRLDLCEENILTINQHLTKAHYQIDYFEYLKKYEEKDVTLSMYMKNKESRMNPELFVQVTRPTRYLELILEVEPEITVNNVKKQIIVKYGDLTEPISEKPLNYTCKNIKDGIETKEYIFKIHKPKLLCTYKIVWEYVENKQKKVVFNFESGQEKR